MELKVNLGCGFKKHEGFINVDKSPNCEPDLVLNLVKEKWPWADSSVNEAIFDFSLEQMGTTPEELQHVLQELYRVCTHEAKISIQAFHPRHDQFFLNPLCTQRLSIEFFQLLSVQRNLSMIAGGMHDDVVGLMWGVNFDIKNYMPMLNARFENEMKEGRISENELREMMVFQSNVLHVIAVELMAVKN